MQKGTTFVAHVHVYVYCSKSDISNNIMIFITVNTPQCACDEAYGSQLVYLCVYLCICMSHSDNVPLARCHEPPVAPFNIITRSPVHGGSDTVNFTGRRIIDYARTHLIYGITTTVNGTPCNDIERNNGRFVAPRKRDVIAVSVTWISQRSLKTKRW